MEKNIFGKRICVTGPSGSGKSTFTEKLGKKLNYPILHIDQIAHIPNTNWKPAPREETQKKHDMFIEKDCWVIDGQYPRYMPQRLTRADTLIIIHANRFKCLWRYLRRSRLKGNHIGAMQNAQGHFNWNMILVILFKQPKRWKKQMKIIKQYPHLNIINAYSFKDLDELIK